MKCYACGSDRMNNTMSQCPDCGFSNIAVAGDEGEFLKELKKIADEYRESKIGGSRLSLMTYQYALKDDRLVLDHEEEYELSMDVAGMEPGQIWWDSTNIARIDAGEPMDLSLAIKRAGQERREKVSVKAPGGTGYWHIGIKYYPGFRFTVLVGNSKEYAETGLVALC